MKKTLFLALALIASAVSMAWACGDANCNCAMNKSGVHKTTSSDSEVKGNGGNFAKGSAMESAPSA